MISSEFGSFRQRYILTESDVSTLKNSPNEIWTIPDTDANVGEFGVTELSNFIGGMTDIRTTISTISKTPKHYFFNKGGDPSGEALIAMEAPLNKKCDNYIKSLIEYWRDVVGFMAVIDNLNIDVENITPVFVPPETIQPKTESEIMQAEVGIGLPVVTVLRNHGWTDAEIKQYEKDKAAEQMANAELAAAYMDQARRNSNEDEE